MRSIKISLRLALGFGVLIALMLIMSSIGVWRLLNIDQANDQLRHIRTGNNLLTQWSSLAERSNPMATALTEGPDTILAQDLVKRIIDNESRTTSLLLSIDKFDFPPQSQAAYDQAKQLREELLSSLDAAYAILQAQRGTAIDYEQLFTQTEDYIAGIALINAAQGQSLAQLFNTITADINTGLKTLGIATLISLLFAFWFARRVTLSITQPLRQAIYLAQTVAQRDLSLRIQPAGKDEITELEQSLATMNHSLNAAISEVYAGIEAIATATTQINSGNLDLSARTEQQAGALTETASTIEEFTTTVRQNADHALQANELAQTATQTANNGGQMVQNLIGTMTEIHTKTEQIGDIVELINSIAFQTNILALNAAVEAARAGEQGRGFAVVAAEVRALAQRSAASAKEIEQIIENSIRLMEEGNTQTQQTGQIMKTIIQDIRHTTELLHEVSAASKEQSLGVDEVNIAISQIDDATRQNAALAEQTATAGDSLHEQAQNLTRLVSSFKLQENTLDQADYAPAFAINTGTGRRLEMS